MRRFFLSAFAIIALAASAMTASASLYAGSNLFDQSVLVTDVGCLEIVGSLMDPQTAQTDTAILHDLLSSKIFSSDLSQISMDHFDEPMTLESADIAVLLEDYFINPT